MNLGEYLDVEELHARIASKHIVMQRHPTLPLAILNYTNSCMFEDLWTDTIQKCRGLIINATLADMGVVPNKDCNILSRPFHKFFNLNHPNQSEYQEQNLPLVEPTVTEKMDGWFGIMWQCGEHYGVASRGSFVSPGAVFATQKLQKLVKYGAVDEFPKGYTPIFEIIFREGKVVVDYPFEGLVLLACVNNETGEELPYDDLQKVWAKIAGYSADNRPWIRLVKAHRMTLKECLTCESRVMELIEQAKRTHELPEGYSSGSEDNNQRNSDGSVKNQEGFVLSFARPGTYPIKVKVKFEEYKRLHKLITGVTPQQIWRQLYDPMAQWFDSDIPKSFRDWAEKWREELYGKFDQKLANIHHIVNDTAVKYPGYFPLTPEDRKKLFEILQKLYPQYANLTMSYINGHHYEVHQGIWKSIRPVGRESETFYREGDGE